MSNRVAFMLAPPQTRLLARAARSITPGLIVIALCGMGFAQTGAADELVGRAHIANALPAERPRKGSFGLVIGGDHWSDATHLVPSVAAFPEIRSWNGTFSPGGYGGGAFYERVVGRLNRADLLVGGELGAYANRNPSKSFSGTDVGTGEVIRVSLGAAINYLTLNARYVSRPRGSLAFNVGLGVGPYLFFPSERIDRIGEVDTHDAVTGGGFLGVGLDRFLRRSTRSIRLDARIHAFHFRDLTQAFPGQHVSGPLVCVELGLVGWH